jgi:hypothetical protein
MRMGRADGKGCGRGVLIEEGWKYASKVKLFFKLYEFDRVSRVMGVVFIYLEIQWVIHG